MRRTLNRIRAFLVLRKYEILLLALAQHLYIGLVLPGDRVYELYIWPFNMLIIALASVGLFHDVRRRRLWTKNVLVFLIVVLPLMTPGLMWYSGFLAVLCVVYILFFAVTFSEVLRFLIRPNYIDSDIISASLSGYLLLIEVAVFSFMLLQVQHPAALSNVDNSSLATSYIDIVYFATITQTTIGYGDITPTSGSARLLTSVFGLVSQFYSVILVGILISKFSSMRQNQGEA